ncbi:MAG: RNA 3'-terminal phosphate cyclase [Candidatus Woesearchaeota archaeon]
MIEIDGSFLEGGGQILRTSLGLSSLTGKAFTIRDIRKGRCNPGLQAQHLSCVRAAQELCNATVSGATLGSTSVAFEPAKLSVKDISVDIGTAGSITLLMQSILSPSCFAAKDFTISVTGGTDVPWSQPVDYFRFVLLPYLRHFASFDLELLRRGYYPKGQGRIKLTIKPRFGSAGDFLELLKNKAIPAFSALDRGKLKSIKGISHASLSLKSSSVAERQASSAQTSLKHFGKVDISASYDDTASPGSGITLWAEFEDDGVWPVIIGADALGKKGVSAESVGKLAASNLSKQIESGCLVDSFLADQLLPFLVFAPKASFLTSEITPHCRTNAYVIEKFLDVRFAFKDRLVTC